MRVGCALKGAAYPALSPGATSHGTLRGQASFMRGLISGSARAKSESVRSSTMRKLLPMLVGSLALVAGPAQAKPADHEAELARAVAGRVAGEPVDCIDMHRVRSSH